MAQMAVLDGNLQYERIREISAEMISYKTEISTEKVQNLFCSDVGYQTPKIDTRAAIFKDGKITSKPIGRFLRPVMSR